MPHHFATFTRAIIALSICALSGASVSQNASTSNTGSLSHNPEALKTQAPDSHARETVAPDNLVPPVAPEPEGSPTLFVVEPAVEELEVQLAVSDPWIERSGSTTLNWTSTGASSCTASRGWSGPRTTNGSQRVGPLVNNQSYAVTCSQGQDDGTAIVNVSIRQAEFAWEKPTTNMDGSALTNLSGYRIHWGTSRGNYSATYDITDKNQTSHVLELSPGTYYFNLTSLNDEGVQSDFSVERSKTIE